MNPLSHNYLNYFPFINQSRQHQYNYKGKNHKKSINFIHQEKATDKMQGKYRRISSTFDHIKKRTHSCLQYTHEGYMFAYTKTENTLNGRSIIIFPEGIIANCNVLNNYLSGWIIICKKNVFYNISRFQKGRFQGIQYSYDINLGLMVQSVYKNGKIQEIKHGVADSDRSFEKYIKNKEIIALLKETLDHQYFKNKYPLVQSPSGTFYGQIQNQMPRGIGILITQSEYFYGEFMNGLLSGHGTMLFDNGDNYIGQFQSGMIKRYGIQTTKGSPSVKYNNETYVQIIEADYKQICSYQDTQLYQIYNPIINFYKKLKEIYEQRLSGRNVKEQVSFVDVNFQNMEQENEQKTDRSSSSSQKSKKKDYNNSKIEIDIQLLNSYIRNDGRTFQYGQKDKNKKTLGIKQVGKIKKQEESKTKLVKSSMILDEKEWGKVIQELSEEQSFINRQNGFLKPKRQKIDNAPKQSKQVQVLKKNPMNNRLNLGNLKFSQQSLGQQRSLLQNTMMDKLINPK